MAGEPDDLTYILIIGACLSLGLRRGCQTRASVFQVVLSTCLVVLPHSMVNGFQKSIISSKAGSCVDLLRPCKKSYTASLPTHLIVQNRSQDPPIFKKRK